MCGKSHWHLDRGAVEVKAGLLRGLAGCGAVKGGLHDGHGPGASSAAPSAASAALTLLQRLRAILPLVFEHVGVG